MVILVRNKGLSQLDKDNMWSSWYVYGQGEGVVRAVHSRALENPIAAMAWRVILFHTYVYSVQNTRRSNDTTGYSALNVYPVQDTR